MFDKIKSFFKKSNANNELDASEEHTLDDEKNYADDKRNKPEKKTGEEDALKTAVKDANSKNEFDWFADRYQSLVVQRNISIFLLIIAIICITGTGVSLAIITKSKTIEPFVIEIEKTQGLVTYVNNNSKTIEYSQNEALRNYFIKQYIEARETYDTKNSDYFYYKVVRAMSSDTVYRQFLSILRSGGKSNPINLLANNQQSSINITSITPLKSDTLQIRFVVLGDFANSNSVRVNKVAILEYNYYNIDLDQEKRYINPLGFLVTSYKVSDENA